MIKKGFVVTVIFVISTFIQLVSQIVVTRIFGARFDLDVFLAAVTIPTILVTVIYGTLNDAFLPIYGEKLVKDEKKADSYLFSTLFIFTFVSLVVVSLMGPFSKQINLLFYGVRGEEFVQQVSMQTYYMLFSIPLSIVATLLGTYFYVRKKLLRFPIAQLVGSIANLLLIIILAPLLGIWSLVLAFVINIIFQIILIIPTKVHLNFQVINLIPLLTAWLPLIIGMFALRSDTLLIRSFAVNLPEGHLVYLNLISKIFSIAAGVMTIGIQIILLPHLVEYFAKREYEKAFKNILKAKLTAILISIVVVILLTLISPFIINYLFVGGKFSTKDAQNTIILLPMFVVPAIGWGINGVFFQPLLALKKQIHLGILNVLALILGWGTASVVKQQFGSLPAITLGLIVLLFTGIIGSEILWQYYKKKLLSHPPQV